MPNYSTSLSDYHLHSTASDGKLSPAQVVELAAQQGLHELALTDHDTFAGVAEAQAVAQKLGLTFFTGMEFSTSWQGVGIHLVALWPQGLTPEAEQLAHKQEELRWQRADKLLARLSKTPVALTKEEVLAVSGGQVPGRPHFAQAMLAKGLVKTENLAFKKWLGSGKLGDIKNFWLELDDALLKLKQAGAFVSLAHPWQYKLTLSKRKRLLQAFVEAGGDAVEVVSGRQIPSQTSSLAQLAQELGLKFTWGSDFHQQGNYCRAPGDFSSLPADCQILSQVFESWTPANY